MRRLKLIAVFFLISFSSPLVQSQRVESTRLELRHGIPFVHAIVNGQGPFTFIVDTGTSNQMIVSPELARKLNLPVVASRTLSDLGGHQRQLVAEVALDRLDLAGHSFSGVRAIVHSAVEGEGAYDGILGFALFRDVVLSLDYPHRRLELSNEPLSGTDLLPLRRVNGVPAVELTIGDEQLEAQIDTGALSLSLPATVAHDLKFSGQVEKVAQARSQVSSYLLWGGTLRQPVAMGSHQFSDPFVEINPGFAVANLGAAPLRDFVVRFDQRRNLLAFDSASHTHRLRRPAESLSLDPQLLLASNHAPVQGGF